METRYSILVIEDEEDIANNIKYNLERVWGYNYIGESRTIDVHISRLRQKLGGDEYIQTIVGLGYRFKDHRKPS